MVKGQGTKAAMKICTGLGSLVDFWRKVRAYKTFFVGMPSMIKIRFYGHFERLQLPHVHRGFNGVDRYSVCRSQASHNFAHDFVQPTCAVCGMLCQPLRALNLKSLLQI